MCNMMRGRGFLPFASSFHLLQCKPLVLHTEYTQVTWKTERFVEAHGGGWTAGSILGISDI